MVHLVHLLITSRISSIRGQYDEIYVNGGVVYPWFMTLHLWFMTVYSSRGLDLVNFLLTSRIASIRGQYDEIYVNGGVVHDGLLFSWP